MNIDGRKHPAHFVQYILQESECIIFARAKNILCKTALGYFHRNVETSQPRIRIERRLGMSGHVDLGNNRNASIRRIADNLFHLFLRVEALLLWSLSYESSDPSQERIAFYLDTPAEALGQMPMKVIHFQHRSHIDILLDGRDLLVLTSRIQHKATPFHPRKVSNFYTREYQLVSYPYAPLSQALNGINKTGVICRTNSYFRRSNKNAISLCRKCSIFLPADLAMLLLSTPFHITFRYQFFIKQT